MQIFHFIKQYARQRLSLSLVLLGFSIAIAFTACTSSNNTANALPAECRIGYQISPNSQLLAKSLGLIETEFPDVKIRWVPFAVGWKVNAAIRDGDIDMGLVGSIPAATGIAQGLPIEVFMVHDIIADSEALVVSEASSIQSIADLPGKKIGVLFGSTSHFSLLSAISQAGIDPNQVNIIDMTPSELLSAWNNNKVDGGFIWQPVLSSMKKDGGKILITARQLDDKGATTAELSTVSKSFAAAYPVFISRFITAIDDAVQIYRQNPAAAAELMAKEVNLSPQESLTIMDELVWLNTSQQPDPQYLGTPENPGAIAQVLKDSADFMAAQNAIPPAPDLSVFQAHLFNENLAPQN